MYATPAVRDRRGIDMLLAATCMAPHEMWGGGGGQGPVGGRWVVGGLINNQFGTRLALNVSDLGHAKLIVKCSKILQAVCCSASPKPYSNKSMYVRHYVQIQLRLCHRQ